MDWRLNTLIKGPSETGNSWYSNIVGTLQTKDKEYIYKTSRLPSDRGYWEFFVSNQIKKNLPSVKNFARVVDVQPLMLDVDEDGRTLPSTKTKSFFRKERSVMIQKIIHGLSIAKHIKFGCTEQFLFGLMIQTLAALDAAQLAVNFTHFDLHGNNVLLKAEKMYEGNRQIFHLYDVGNSPMLIPSYGYRTKIIDYEYSYVKGVEGKAFDSRLDLINHFYIPCEYDSSYDILRFVISCCSYMGERQSSDLCKKIVKEVTDVANSFDSVKFREIDGLIEELKDPIREKVLQISEKKTNQFKDMINGRYYYLVGVLLHNIKLPLKKIHNINTEEERLLQIEFFTELISLLIEFSPSIDKCCISLYEFLKGDKSAFIKMGETWNAKLRFLIHASIDSLQTLYHDQIKKCKEIRARQGERKFSPIKMIRYLQSRIDLKKDIKNGDIIYWMNKEKRKKLTIQLSEKQQAALNSTYDIFQRGKKLKFLLNKI